jgi:C_GCAxxG_C_C family probable redox protein
MSHAEKAVSLFKSGYNCSQAVFAAFCDVTGIDEQTALMIASSFGGGMGRMREVCGAVSGMFMVAGRLYGYADPCDNAAKKEHYALIQRMAAEFKEENGSIICRELLGLAPDGATPTPRTDEFYKKRPCVELVAMCAEIMDKIIAEKGIN